MRALLPCAALVLGFAGCLVVSPLEDDYPEPSSKGGHSGSTSQAGSSSDAGDAGETSAGGKGPSSGSCETNADCVRPGAGAPYRCRPADHACIPLYSDECPVVLGPAGDPNAIYFGAFAAMNPLSPEKNSIFWAHELARDELSGDNRGGLRGGPGGASRPLVMIGCSNAEASIEPALEHLIENVEVPALLATLKPGDLRRAFEAYRSREIFYLSPVSVTSTLLEEDDGLIWNLLGQPSDLAPTYLALMRLSESYVRKAPDVDDVLPIRVAFVTTTDAFDSELADSVRAVLEFNGKPVDDNAATDYLDVTINPADDLEALGTQIAEFRPHIIVSAASELFSKPGGLMDQIEIPWDVVANDSMKRPFYVLSPYNAGDLANVQAFINGQLKRVENSDAHTRFVGVTIAGAEDTSLQSVFGNKLLSRFPSAFPDTANYYDAVYFLAYAMYGSSDDGALTGPGIADGMQRLLSGSQSIDVGSTTINQVFDALDVEAATVQLNSTLGPPTFAAESGVRPVDGGVFCFAKIGPTTSDRRMDVLRYDRALEKLRGTSFPCFSGFYP